MKSIPLFTTLLVLSPGAFGQSRLPLYRMGGLSVEVTHGDVVRKPQVSHKTHELDHERSSPLSDPSPTTGYHFSLEDFMPQAEIGQRMALRKLNPFDSRGFLRGNWIKGSESRYYRERVSAQDPIFALLKKRQAAYLYGRFDLENGPALVNSDYEFEGISDRAFGFCWGFSTVNRAFAYGAFFDPTLRFRTNYIRNGLERNEAWFRPYERIIDDILNGKPRVIPGFKDFAEFSAVPEIEFYLKLKAAEAWAMRAISTGSLKTFFTSTKELDDEGINSLVRRLAAKLKRGELPKVLFTAADSRKQMGGSLDVHSVMVNGVKMNPDGTGRIEIWDINFYFSDLQADPKFIEIRRNARTGKRELHYGPWYEEKETAEASYRSSLLGKVRLTPEDESEMGTLIRNLKKFCGDERTTSYCR